MELTTSKDGTRLAYERVGTGPALVFVPGVFNLRDTCADVAEELAPYFTSYLYDRRARGDSGNTLPYSASREAEDLDAMIAVAGGSASVFGYSSGAMVALQAAAMGAAIERLFLYEPPFRFEGPELDAGLPARLQALLDAGHADEVVTAFQREAIGLPEEAIAGIQQAPFFPMLKAMAQSVVYDATFVTEFMRPSDAMAVAPVPTTVLRGGETWPILAVAAERLATLLPQGQLRVLAEVTGHGLEPVATARVIRELTPSKSAPSA